LPPEEYFAWEALSEAFRSLLRGYGNKLLDFLAGNFALEPYSKLLGLHFEPLFPYPCDFKVEGLGISYLAMSSPVCSP